VASPHQQPHEPRRLRPVPAHDTGPQPGTNTGTGPGTTGHAREFVPGLVPEPDTSGARTQDKAAGKVSVATALVRLAEAGYDLGCTPEGEPFALATHGPPLVRLLRGGRGSLRAELASAHYEHTGTAASQSALADACAVLEGKAQRVDPTPLYLRVAEHDDALVLDLGDQSGRAVLITPDMWKLTDTPPVLFRRTALTGPLPEPVGGADFAGLWDALNVAVRYQPVVLAVLVAALMPTIPHPVVLLTGEQGTGKSTATARLASVIDPSPAQLRKAPRDVDAWTTAAAGSWVVPLDNLSTVSEWLSDALCRASTGDGDVRRRLFTDSDLHVIAFRRVPLINGIEVGALRPDLADRLVHLGLDRIPDTARRREQQMAAQWAQAHPKVLGALLDLTVQVLAVLPTVQLEASPRMADFARVLAAVDLVCHTGGLGTYLGLRDELAEDAVTSDPVLVALTRHVTGEFTGTAGELATAIHPRDEHGHPLPERQLPKDWPATPRALTAVLTRQAPTLRQLGWTIRRLERGTGGAPQVRWELSPSRARDGGQRRPVNDAADAADAAADLFSQVNDGTSSAASGPASSLHPDPDAATAASTPPCTPDAGHDAAGCKQALTSTNRDHPASAASAASFPGLLCPPTLQPNRAPHGT
jgi:hypothetical protein